MGPGDVAADREVVTTGHFFQCADQVPAAKGGEFNTVMTRVEREVAERMKNDCAPWANSDLTTRVYLAPAK